MADIAILGYGTVGSGVFETFNKNSRSIHKKAQQPVRVRKVLDLRVFPGDPVEKVLTHDYADILNNNDIRVVVETMGGTVPAYDYVKKALLRGKSVVTSNKELVAKYGSELLEIAREKNINFLFEASVGGGIPIIRPLNESLTADEIYEITGILNGTSNFILTKMEREGSRFEEALKEAQAGGYAERNPSADVDGYDAARKLAILLCLALGEHVDYEDIYTEGISKITPQDLKTARTYGGVVKLLATAEVTEQGVLAMVAPAIVPDGHPFTTVDGVFNAILVKGNVIDQVMFYGRGAGKFPTASAVVADVVDAVRHLNQNVMQFWSSEKYPVLPIDDLEVAKLIRLNTTDPTSTAEVVEEIFGKVRLIEAEGLAFVSNKEKWKAIDEKIARLTAEKGLVVESAMVIMAE